MFITSLMFFTRLPLWRWFSVPSENFQRVIYYWPFAGWITSLVMALTFTVSLSIFPLSIAVILVIISRVVLTGALHEDGLADFLDGFGGGSTREKTLAIMKDSHAGTYAILGLVLYFLLMHQTLSQFDPTLMIAFLLITDPFCKMLSSFITLRLPYARTLDTSKIKTIYAQATHREIVTSLSLGLLPFFCIGIYLPNYYYLLAIITPIALFFLLTQWMQHKIQGYTGDCAGALFLLLELSMLLTLLAIHTQL